MLLQRTGREFNWLRTTTMLILLLFLAGCQSDIPALPATATQTALQASSAPPIKTPSHTPSRTALATATPTSTLTPALTHTQTPYPTATPIPLSLPPAGQALTVANATQLQELARWGVGQITSRKIIAGGELALVESAYDVRLLRVDNLEVVQVFENVAHTLLAADEQTLVVSYRGKSHLEIWSLPGGKLLQSLQFAIEAPRYTSEYFSLAAYRSVRVLRFSRDGKLLVAGFGNAQIGVWRTDTWEQVAVLASNISNVTRKLIFSRDGQYLASLESGGAMGEYTGIPRLVFWNLADYSLRGYLANPGSVGEDPFSSDSTYLLTGHDYKVLIYKMSNFRLLRSFASGSDNRSAELSFSPDDAYVIVDHAQVRRFSDGKRLNAGPETTVLAELGLTGEPQDAATPLELHRLEQAGYYPAFQGMSLVEGSTGLLAWGVQGERLYWLRLPQAEFSQVELGSRAMNAAALAPDGSSLVLCLESKELALVDLMSAAIQRIPGCRPGGRLAFLPGGRLLRSNGMLVDLVELPDGTVTNTLRGHTAKVTSLFVSPDGGSILSGTQTEADHAQVSLWSTQPLLARVSSFAIPDLFPSGNSGIEALALSADGSQLATARPSGDVDAYHLPGEYQLWTARVGNVLAMAYAPGGDILAVGGDMGAISLVETARGEQIYPGSETTVDATEAFVMLEMFGYSDRTLQHYAIRALVFLPDGTGLYSVGDDGMLRLWGVP